MFTFARSVGLARLWISRLPDGRGSGSSRRVSSATTRPENFDPWRRDLPRRLLARLPDAPSAELSPAAAAAAGSAAPSGSAPGSSSANAGCTTAAVAKKNAAPHVARRNISQSAWRTLVLLVNDKQQRIFRILRARSQARSSHIAPPTTRGELRNRRLRRADVA